MASAGEIAKILRKSKSLLVVGHLRPDVDAIGSTLALYLALSKAGKKVTALNVSGLPESMRFLPGSDRMVTKLHPRRRFDACITLDSGSGKRFGDFFFEMRDRLGRVIKIDHHRTQEDFADLEYVDDRRASCAQLVADVIEAYPIEMDKDIAVNIYAAIVSDTGGFRYANTDGEAFCAAGQMLELGADPWEVSSKLYEDRPLPQIRLLAEALSGLDISACGRWACVTVTREMMQRHKAEPQMLDGFVNFARAVRGVEVAILLDELPDREGFRISLRSKGKVDVSLIAQQFGGGGHANAAGCRIDGSAREVCRKLYGIIERTID